MRSPEQCQAVATRPLKLAENLQVVVDGQEMNYEAAAEHLHRHLGEAPNMIRADLLLAFCEKGEGSTQLPSGIQVTFRLLEKLESNRERFERLAAAVS